MINLQKNTADDKRQILSDAVDSLFSVQGVYVYLRDYDDEYIYFRYNNHELGTNATYRLSYDYTGTSATLSGALEEVVQLSDYRVVGSEPVDKGSDDKGTAQQIKPVGSDLPNSTAEGKGRGALAQGYALEFVEKNGEESFFQKFLGHFGPTKENINPVVKQFEDEQMIAIEPLYIVADGVDGQGDTYSREDANNMCTSLNKAIDEGRLQHGLFHKHSSDAFEITKSWVNEFECTIGDSVVLEGQPLAKVQFKNQAAWDLRKSGTLMGLSIGARATEVEYLDE